MKSPAKRYGKDALFQNIKAVLEAARSNSYRAVNTAMVQSYWEVGRLIVEDEQKGAARAGYGKTVLIEQGTRLTAEFGKGFDESNLRHIRNFYKAFPIRGALRHELTWTHYRLLTRVSNEKARTYYVQEAVNAGWSSRELQRQIHSFYYERLLGSQKGKKAMAPTTETTANPLGHLPEDFIKNPFVLEFLNLPAGTHLKEKDFESLLLKHLEAFILELGRGFAFVSRQEHIRADGEDFYIDLVFYHFKLKCFVLIDLKVGKLTHEDIGQMDMYVRMYKERFAADAENPPIGLILCSERNEAIVKYSVLAENERLFASAYKLHLPTEEELKSLLENDRLLLEEAAEPYHTAYA